MEPIILELEREKNDLLIIAHDSVLRVLYGYLLACPAYDIPNIEFPRDEIIEVRLNTLFFSSLCFTSQNNIDSPKENNATCNSPFALTFYV